MAISDSVNDKSETSHRGDNRTANQLRPLVCVRNLLNRADGSARWAQDQTSVLAAVYGPRPVGGRRENAERATLEVIWKPKVGQSGRTEREAEAILRRTLEIVLLTALHPRTGILVVLQVVHDDGSLLACAVNAACAALVDAGIAMRGLLWAHEVGEVSKGCHVAVLRSGRLYEADRWRRRDAAGVSCAVLAEGEVILDPTKAEEQAAQAHVCLAFPTPPLSVKGGREDEGEERADEEVVTSVTRGAMSVDDYLTCLARARAATRQLGVFFRASLERYQRGAEMSGLTLA